MLDLGWCGGISAGTIMLTGWGMGLRRLGRRYFRDRRGNVAMIFALAMPALLLAAGGAVDLTSVIRARVKMQAVADEAALNAASQLGLDNSPTTARRAENLAKEQLTDLTDRGGAPWSLTVSAQVIDKGTAVQISIHGHRSSYFHDLLPKGGWTVSVSATAVSENRMPLCVLAFDDTLKDAVHIQDTSAMTASNCLVQSDKDIHVDKSAGLTAGMVQAAGQARGTTSPQAQTGAPTIPDPFASLDVTIPTGCTDTDRDYTGGSNELAAGVHCGNITVEKNASLTLLPGEHYFANGHFQVQDSAQVKGTDVVLVFDKDTHLDFQNNASIALEARKSGPYAGFVIATVKNNKLDFSISATSARELLGVVYIPRGTLNIEGNSKVADASAWTVIVAKGVHLSGGPDLVINSNYAATTVPVPNGVGPSTAKSSVSLKS